MTTLSGGDGSDPPTLTVSNWQTENETPQSNMFPLLSPLQIFLFHSVTIHPEDFTQCTTHGSFLTHWHETVYNMFTFSCLFLLPLVIMITCYTRIFCEISKRLKTDNCKLKSCQKFSRSGSAFYPGIFLWHFFFQATQSSRDDVKQMNTPGCNIVVFCVELVHPHFKRSYVLLCLNWK